VWAGLLESDAPNGSKLRMAQLSSSGDAIILGSRTYLSPNGSVGEFAKRGNCSAGGASTTPRPPRRNAGITPASSQDSSPPTTRSPSSRHTPRYGVPTKTGTPLAEVTCTPADVPPARTATDTSPANKAPTFFDEPSPRSRAALCAMRQACTSAPLGATGRGLSVLGRAAVRKPKMAQVRSIRIACSSPNPLRLWATKSVMVNFWSTCELKLEMRL
jgi:hypothetical protein